jgi:hypothetical protein
MRDVAFAHVGDDLDVSMAVHAETGRARRDVVVVPYIEVADRLVPRVALRPHLEMVLGPQPAEVCAIHLRKWAMLDYGDLPQSTAFTQAGCSSRAAAAARSIAFARASGPVARTSKATTSSLVTPMKPNTLRRYVSRCSKADAGEPSP